MKKGIVLLAVVVLLVLLATVAWADGVCPCPENTELVAKFEWNGDTGTYIFEKPKGNEDVVSIVGDATGGTWTSTIPIAAVVLKGGPGCHTYSYDPAATAGNFSKNDLPDNPGGQRPNISNVQFCEAKPTAVRLVHFDARPFKLPWLHELLRWLRSW